MVKFIRRPLTDINGRDIMTGHKVKPEIMQQEIEQPKRIRNWLKKKQEEAMALGRTDGKIYIESLGGWVN